MPAAIAVPAIISAAGSIGGAAINAWSSNKAAKQQIASGDRALDVYKQTYEQSRGDLMPWISQGQQAVSTLGGLMGLGTGTGGAPTSGAPKLTSSNPDVARVTKLKTDALLAALAQAQQPETPSAPSLGAPQTPTPKPLASVGTGQTPQSAAQTQTASSYVLMRAPTGATRPVSADQVPFYVQRGATVVG